MRPPIVVSCYVVGGAALVCGVMVIWGFSWSDISIVGLALLFALAVMFVSMLVPFLHRFTDFRPATSTRDEGIGPALITMQRQKPLHRWPRESYWPWNEIREVATHPLPRTIADRRMQQRLGRIELSEELLEPEAILGSLWMKRGWLFVLIALFALNAALTTAWLKVFYLMMIGYLLIQLPSIRDVLRLGDGKVIAGLGVVETSRGKRWTVDDAIMIVQTQDGEPPLTVFLTGEAGELKLHFIDEKDPDFIKLWQRWNHPNPRPELLVT
jgi:hypothetical protein